MTWDVSDNLAYKSAVSGERDVSILIIHFRERSLFNTC
jgi:hypothetical protein